METEHQAGMLGDKRKHTAVQCPRGSAFGESVRLTGERV